MESELSSTENVLVMMNEMILLKNQFKFFFFRKKSLKIFKDENLLIFVLKNLLLYHVLMQTEFS